MISNSILVLHMSRAIKKLSSAESLQMPESSDHVELIDDHIARTEKICLILQDFAVKLRAI